MLDYQQTFIDNLQSSEVRIEGLTHDVAKGIKEVTDLLLLARERKKQVFIVGNGASAAISSHTATDFIKTLGIRAVHISDNSLLTCMGNDYGYENVYAAPLRVLAQPGDILMAISSSGKSANILSAAEEAGALGCTVITFSGFAPDNPLSAMGVYNFFVPSQRYGFVETIHAYMLHWITDSVQEMILHDVEAAHQIG